MIKSLMIAVLLVWSTVQSSQLAAQSKFTEHSFTLNGQGQKVEYLAYLPKNYYASPRYTPVLIFLHGGDEIGGELSRVKKSGPLLMADKGKDFDFIIVAPHLPVEMASSWNVELVKQTLDDARSKYRIDPSRVYIMGFAKGGAGAWAFSLKYPELVAAAIPISGYGEVSNACKMKEVPTWAFHKKSNTPANSTMNMVRSLQKCSNQVMYNDYIESWAPQIDDKNVFDWMLAQSKNRFLSFGKTRLTDQLQSYKLPLALKNPSGILKGSDGAFWSINDGQGRQPLLFNFDTTGQIKKTVRISNAPNLDWEDLTQDNQGNLFIADIGNEANVRKNFNVYKIRYDQINEGEKVEATTISFTLPDQREFPPVSSRLNFDLESIFWYNHALYFFSKNRTKPFTGYSKLYKVPDSPGSYTAVLLDSLKLPSQGERENGWITSAALDPGSKKLILLGYDKVWQITDFTNDQFCQGKVTEIALQNSSRKKGVTFGDESTLLLVDEYFLGTKDGNLYFFRFSDK